MSGFSTAQYITAQRSTASRVACACLALLPGLPQVYLASCIDACCCLCTMVTSNPVASSRLYRLRGGFPPCPMLFAATAFVSPSISLTRHLHAHVADHLLEPTFACAALCTVHFCVLLLALSFQAPVMLHARSKNSGQLVKQHLPLYSVHLFVLC